VVEFLRARVLGAWQIIEKHLARQPFMVGAEPTVADFSLAGYVYYPEATGIDRGVVPQINAWADRIKALDGWKHPYDLMPGGPKP
jgi:glutathione S-transferase